MRYVILSVLSVLAVAGTVMFILKLAARKPEPVATKTCRLVPWLSISGVLTFVIGFWLSGLPELDHQSLGLALLVGGFVVAGGSVVLNAATAKVERAAWPVVSGRCIDHTLQMKVFSNGSDCSEGWLWRVVCEINYGGKDYVVTPKVRWSDASQGESAFWKQEKAQRFIAERISPTGECKVRVNPNNPVDSELVALRAQRKFRGFVRAENQSPP